MELAIIAALIVMAVVVILRSKSKPRTGRGRPDPGDAGTDAPIRGDEQS